MADQFCRILNTTMCDMTLGSDATQSILTTDANTSYVIRDVFKEDSSTQANLVFRGDLVMDGVTVHSGLSTGANGTLIVPPSSALCYKDTSGNYPLSFKCFAFDVFYCCTCPAGNNYNRCSFLAPAGVPSASTVSGVCAGSVCSGCCGNEPNSGSIKYHPGSCTLTMIYHDGNSTTTVYMQCTNIATGARSTTETLNLGYKPGLVTNNEFLQIDSNTKGMGYAFGRCGSTQTSFSYCFCTHSGGSHTTYAEGGVSIGGHPCHHIGCIAILDVSGNAAGATVKLYAIDACCYCSGNWVKSELIWCRCKALLPAEFQSRVSNGNQYYTMNFYSKTCDSWLTGLYAGQNGLFVYDGVTNDAICINVGDNEIYQSYPNQTHFESTLLVGRTAECKIGIIDLEEVVKGTATSLSYLESPYSSTCYACYTTICGCIQTPTAIGTLCISEPSLNSCDYPAIDGSTKIAMYGIKSTT